MIIVGLVFAFLAGALMVTAWNIKAVTEVAAIHWRHRRRLETYAGVIAVVAIAVFVFSCAFILTIRG